MQEVASGLERAIVVASFEEEQKFLLIPPNENQLEWKYWKFAMWIPGEEEFENLAVYFENVIDFLNGQIQEKESKTNS